MLAILEGGALRMKREHNDRAWLAWHTAALGRVKKLPRLQALQIGEKAKRRPQTVDEQIAAAVGWTKALARKR